MRIRGERGKSRGEDFRELEHLKNVEGSSLSGLMVECKWCLKRLLRCQ